jgi:hypothetical protein
MESEKCKVENTNIKLIFLEYRKYLFTGYGSTGLHLQPGPSMV